MILVQALSKNRSQILKIAETLLIEKLVIDVNIISRIERFEIDDSGTGLVTSQVYLLTAKTKALLFPRIDKLLRHMYSDSFPELYSLPIVHMDWDQSKHLTSEVVQV